VKANRKAWGAARSAVPDVLANPDVLDQLIIWRMNDPRYEDRKTRVKGLSMQKQWTIEARADFSDKGKNDMIDQAVKEAAVHINAVIALLSDGIKPQVVAFSDDFFCGHQDLALLEDRLGNAITDHADKVGDAPAVSDEMLQAIRDMKHDQNEGA
jgi:hypothetical protein